MLYPLTFHPIFKERVWGGRKLEQLYQKPLPPGAPIGESWEVSDRPDDRSLIANGPLAGKDLHWLVNRHPSELLGATPAQAGRFPLLVKILDAREKLSLQVHPPAARAAELGGDPKTEMWYIAEAEPGATLYVGLKRGFTRAEFERRLQAGTVAECFHQLQVRAGDAMFLPSGRVHAIGAGLVIFEIQQNSDTTYRVFDWNRVGLDGRPRPLHVAESLASIDFGDVEPALLPRDGRAPGVVGFQTLVTDPLFQVQLGRLEAGAALGLPARRMQVLGVLTGRLQVCDPKTTVALAPGQFCLVPACLAETTLRAETRATVLLAACGQA